MGKYLNPEASAFTKTINTDTFVDHTGMLEILLKKIDVPNEKYIAVSRPRRFGKTMDANMLAAFFEKGGDRSQFQGMEISKIVDLEKAKKYQVLFIDASKHLKRFKGVEPFVNDLEKRIINELKNEFPDVAMDGVEFLDLVLFEVFDKTGEQFIIVIDEWDAPLKLWKGDSEGHQFYFSWLNDLMKGENYLALAYMTGILPIKKYGDDSFMNMFDEYSMIDPGFFAPYMGFTEKDVEMLCGRYGKSMEAYRQWYNGYLLTQSFIKDGLDEKGNVTKEYVKTHIYNPRSITKAFSDGNIADYWNKTGSFESLKMYIDTDMLGLRTSILEMMKGKRTSIQTKEYKDNLASMKSIDQVFTFLVHLGYLTYDAETEEVYIPNRELIEEFTSATSGDAQEYSVLKELLNDSLGLLEYTWRMDADNVAEAIEKAHSLTCSPNDYNKELALSNAVSFAYYAANEYYTIYPEAPAGKGYADLTFIPVDSSHPAMVIELKWNKKVQTAIDQIRKKNYTERLRHYAGNILCVGISYEKTDAEDPKYKKHTCIIEQL